MAQKGTNVHSEKLSCSMCGDLLKDPVALHCGHSYCMNCIEAHWDAEDGERTYSCPQCRKTFKPRPVLEKNVLLAELVEELKKTGLQAAAADHCYAGDEDLMKMFCRTDQQLICYLCSVDQHRGHETVSAAAERKQKQKKLQSSRLNIQQRIQDREKDVKLLQQELEAINVSADKTVEDSEEMFMNMIHLIQRRSSEVKQQIRSQQEAEVSRVQELEEKLQQEISDLKRKDAELKQLSETPDLSRFLHKYPSASALSESTHSSSISIRPRRHFEDVTAAVKELRDKLQDILRDAWTNISLAITDVDVLLSEPTTRAGFLKYSREITLDSNTAHRKLVLSDGNRKVTSVNEPQSPPDHPDRFTRYCQVLSRESLTGRCYWEVEWTGDRANVAVSYQNISRAGRTSESAFGFNDKSWALRSDTNSCVFLYNKTQTPASGRPSSRVGVYLDHRAGVLSFYRVSDTMTLLHRVQTSFTQPLHAGVGLYFNGSTLEFIKPEETL
ncbi:tripartite motif-containing protein 16-like [Stegastes partitus]|uniref:Tripartite motif-containing protein 16-like n=1 Tax=Stegastes partitus TaxID=144197 RepID=A0A9Y4K3U8_9TELE|nr:PREDICTED: tripartite motif-containing protein 16-like [Stegastes partitus]